MDVEQMKADLGPGAVFDIGEENTAFAQYFTGECYLKILTTEGVPIGNVSFAPKTVNHWHGAAKDSWFQHLAVEVPAEGGSNEWLEPVDEEEYNKLS